MRYLNNSYRLPSFKTYIATFLFLPLIYSCKKFVAIDPPINPIPSAVVFTNEATATSAVLGIYSEMMTINSQFSASGVTLYAGMSADELRFYSPSQRDEFIKNQLTEVSHSAISAFFWDRAYKFIYTANLCIEELDKSTSISAPVKKQLQGECKFIRAFCFFHLANLFGDVPLTQTSDFRDNIKLRRSDVNIIYQYIIKNLKEAQSLLPAIYASKNTRVRPNKWAATALLARVYLYMNQWALAETEASAVINAGDYNLEPNLLKVFADTSSREAIWQLRPVNPNVNTWEANMIIPPGPNSIPGYILTQGLLDAFETADERKTAWTAPRPLFNDTFYYPFKYRIRAGGSLVTEFYMVLRLAEQYLVRAEARAWQNKITEAQADLDSIRNRAGLANTTAATQEELLAAIEQERRVEFFAEWGHRWYDLKRTNRVNTILGALKPATWQPTDVLWPIPVAQININPALIQNPGY